MTALSADEVRAMARQVPRPTARQRDDAVGVLMAGLLWEVADRADDFYDDPDRLFRWLFGQLDALQRLSDDPAHGDLLRDLRAARPLGLVPA